jgi:hypothetical protein
LKGRRLLRSTDPDSEFSIIQEKELFLSNESFLELLQAALAKGCSLRVRVRGYSMFPCIRDNDVVTISPVDARTSFLGLAVAFIHPRTNKLFFHRVISQDEGTCVIKGDCLSCADGPIPITNILGVITDIERNGRRVRFGVDHGLPSVLFLNKTGVIAAIFRMGMCLPQSMRQGIKKIICR